MDNHLKELRAKKGWTQDELGRRVGVSRQAIIALEAGKHSPSLDLAFRLASTFGLVVEQVFENPHAGPPAPSLPLSGIGNNPPASPLQFQAEPGRRLVFERKDGSDQLHWQYLTETADNQSRVSSGESVAPGERFAYHWHPESHRLWFATARILQRVTFTDRGTANSWSGSVSGHENDPDLPAEFRAHLAKLLEP